MTFKVLSNYVDWGSGFSRVVSPYIAFQYMLDMSHVGFQYSRLNFAKSLFTLLFHFLVYFNFVRNLRAKFPCQNLIHCFLKQTFSSHSFIFLYCFNLFLLFLTLFLLCFRNPTSNFHAKIQHQNISFLFFRNKFYLLCLCKTHFGAINKLCPCLD